MRLAKLLSGMLLAAAIVAPAFAEGGASDAMVLTIWPNGQVKMVPIFGQKERDMLVQHAKSEAGPVMIMTAGGKTYLLGNAKMASGRMLLDYLNDAAYRGGA